RAFGGWAMKKSTALALLTTVSPVALLIGSPADAADLARKAPIAMPPPAPVYSWTGCYVGAHVGWGWGKNDFSSSSVSAGGGGVTSASGGVTTSGGLFGGQVGCNYQFAGWSPWAGSNWVIGIQGDFAGTDFNGWASDNHSFGDGDEPVRLKSDWLPSVTARPGVTAFNNQALFYGKGGGAWIHNKWYLSNASLDFDGTAFPTETRAGWTIGAGAEWTLWSPAWTAFVEYNFYDFNNGKTLAAFGVGNSESGTHFFNSG